MYVNSFVMSTHILNIMNQHSATMAKHMQRIASGRRINSVVDDPSGWAIGQRMDVRIRALDQANSNTQTMGKLLQVADGGISSTIDLIKTLKEKAIEAANDTATDQDRRTIQKLFDQYVDQIDDNALITYNGKSLLDGSHAGVAHATQQAFTNRSLGENVTLDTKLTDLTRRDGDSLGIVDTDTVTASYVKDGRTYTAHFSAKDATLGDLFKKMNEVSGDAFDLKGSSSTDKIGVDADGEMKTTVDNKNAITVKASATGTDAALGGFAIGITNLKGQAKKSANNVLNSFTETIQARNAMGDTALYAQTGADANFGIKIGIGDMRATALGLRGRDGHVLDVTTREGANAAIEVLDNALNRALDQSTTIGAISSRLEYTSQNLTTESTNLTSAMSTLMDADLAKEMLAYTKENVLMQAAMAMLAQNNQNSAWFLSLLR